MKKVYPVIKITKKQMLQSAILAQFEEQYELGKKINEKILSKFTIKELKKMHELNEVSINMAKNLNINDVATLVKTGLNFLGGFQNAN